MIYDRTQRLAWALSMTPLPHARVEQHHGKWWLLGCAEGDTVLPMTGGARTVYDALEAAEGWLAPLLDSLPPLAPDKPPR